MAGEFSADGFTDAIYAVLADSPRLTPAHEDKAEVYKELDYRQAGMVGVNLAVARPMVQANGHIVQLIGPGREDHGDVDQVREVIGG